MKNGFDFPRALATWAVNGAVDAQSFTPRPPISSLWIAGELMACVEDLKRGRWRDLLDSPRRFIKARCYDDFRMADPLPLIVELAYYLTGFLRTGGDLNPVTVGMMNRAESIYDPASH